MLNSVCLIFNPVSGAGNVRQDLETIRAQLDPHFPLDIRQTSKDVGAQELAAAAIAQGAQTVIASGGDGTVSAVAAALMGTSVNLAIIPRGTANAFAKALCIPNSIEGACATIVNGTPRPVDTAFCNGRPMVLLAGIGFEAETVDNTDRSIKSRLGQLAYVWQGIKELERLDRFKAEVETDETAFSISASAITIANAAPPLSILAQGPGTVVADDGLLDVTFVAPEDVRGAIAASYELLQSAVSNVPAEHQSIGHLRAKTVKVVTDPPQKIALDGEIVGMTPLEVECRPKSLNVIQPQ